MQSEQAVIYVAGNPDLYPLEYYDGESGSYQGAIPAFLEGFAQSYGYDVRYLEPGAEDRRADYAANQQVDLISGCLADERYDHTAGEPLLLFSGESEGEESAYLLYFTSVAPQGLQDDLRAYAARTTQAQWTGEVLQAAQEAPPGRLSPGAIWGIAIAAAVLLAALAAAIAGWVRERRRQKLIVLTDQETGLGTDEALEHQVLADFRAHYLVNMEHKTAPYPGVLELLDRLRAAGIRTAVVSNKFDGAVKGLCQAYFGDRVEVAIGESQGVARKPAPDTVFRALAELGSQAEGAVYIGDSDVDIQTAQNSGLPCISVSWGFRAEAFLLEHGAATIVANREALAELLLEA